ncbi:MAG: MFS transporter [Pseudomonadota bacterium]
MSRRLSSQQLALLITTLMTISIGQSMVFAILAPLGREVGLIEVQINSIIALSALAFALSSPRWGRLSDRVGRRPIIITGLVGYTLGTLAFTSVFYAGLQGVLTGAALYVTLLVVRCIQALVMSASSPAATAYAADHSEPAQRLRTMAKLGTANSLGTILGPAVSGAMAALGLLAPLYFAAALTLGAAAAVRARLPFTPRAERVQHVTRRKLRITDRRIALYIATAVGLFIGYSGIQQTLGFQLQDQFALSGIQTAQYTGVALMIAAAATFLVQVTVMQRVNLKPTQFVRIGLVSLIGAAALLFFAEGYASIAAAMLLLGAGLGVSMPAILSGASLAVAPDEQGAAAGLVTACPALGFSVGPVAAGYLYQVEGTLAPLFSACVFFGVLVMLALKERQHAAEGSAQS